MLVAHVRLDPSMVAPFDGRTTLFSFFPTPLTAAFDFVSHFHLRFYYPSCTRAFSPGSAQRTLKIFTSTHPLF